MGRQVADNELTEGGVVAGLPVALETCIGMLPSSWREKAMQMALHFAAPGFAARLYDMRDQANARRIMSDGLAYAALEEAKKDPALVARMRDRLIHDSSVKQENLESVLLQASEVLQEEVQEGEPPPREEISEDWRRRFTSYAEEISDPEVQQTWARILAGEFRKPGSFSFRTLRLLSELPPSVASLFEKHAAMMFQGAILTLDPSWNTGPLYAEAKDLLEWELVQDAPNQSVKMFDPNGTKRLVFSHGPFLGVAESGDVLPKYEMSCLMLTAAGREIATMLPPIDQRIAIRAILNDLSVKNSSVQKAYIAISKGGVLNPIEAIKG